jgi:hypothetical protein
MLPSDLVTEIILSKNAGNVLCIKTDEKYIACNLFGTIGSTNSGHTLENVVGALRAVCGQIEANYDINKEK